MATSTRRINVWINVNGKQVHNDVASIRNEMQKLVNEQARMTLGSKEYVAATKDIKKLKTILADHSASLRPVPTLYDKIKRSVAGGYTALLGYAASVMAVAYSFKKLYDAAEEQRVADRRLLFALKGNIDAYQQLNAQASELQLQTGIEDSVISQIQMLGVQSGKSVKDVKKITEAAIELSSVTGDDLQTSFMQLNKTYTGVLGKSLPRLSTDFSNLTKEQLKNGEAIDLVLEKYKGTAAESATEVAKMTQAWGEFQEALGNGETGPVNWLIVKMTSLLGVMKDVTEVFFSFGGSRDAWEAQKDGVQSTAISVSNFSKEMQKAQKDEVRWNNIKKNGVESLNKSLATQQRLLDNTKSKIENSTTSAAFAKNGSKIISSQEMNDLKIKQQYEQSSVNTIKSKISVLNQMINPVKKLNEEEDDAKTKTEALKDAFQELGKNISDLDKQINNAIASGNTPLVEKLIREKKAAELLLRTFNEVKKAYANGWDMSQRDQGSIDTLVGIGANIVKSENTTDSPLVKRTFDNNLSGPSEKVQEDEAKAQDLRDKIKAAAFQAAQELNDTIFSIVANRQQAEFDHELSMLEKRRQAELDNKNLTESQKLAINEKYDKQSAALKAKQFKKQQNAAAIQAGINGAIGITKTFAEFGFTPPGWIAAAALAVSTLLQIAAIKAAPVPEFYEGGFTSVSNNSRNPAGVVHDNEYVVPEEGLKNPRVRAIVNQIEIARINKSLPTLNPMIDWKQSRQMFSGGFSDQATSKTENPTFIQTTNTGRMSVEEMQIMKEFTSVLKSGINDGLHTKLSLFDLEKIQKDKSTIQSATEM